MNPATCAKFQSAPLFLNHTKILWTLLTQATHARIWPMLITNPHRPQTYATQALTLSMTSTLFSRLIKLIVPMKKYIPSRRILCKGFLVISLKLGDISKINRWTESCPRLCEKCSIFVLRFSCLVLTWMDTEVYYLKYFKNWKRSQ